MMLFCYKVYVEPPLTTKLRGLDAAEACALVRFC
jgi:hypothetical protein